MKKLSVIQAKKQCWNKKTPEGWEIQTATTFEELEQLRDVWQEIQFKERSPQINADHERFVTLLKAKDNKAQPYVMLIKYKSQLKTIVIGYIEKLRINCRIGYLTLLKPTMRCFSIVYGGIIGEKNSEAAAVLIEELKKNLKNCKMDVVFFNHLRVDSDIFQLSKKLPGILSRDYLSKMENHSCMSVPKNIEEFFQTRSHNHRAKLKRYMKNLEKEFPNQVKMITYTKESDLDEAVRDASKVSRVTYQYELGVGFRDTERKRTLLMTSARKGWLRLHILYINGEPVAFQNIIKYGNQYVGYGIGFDPKWSRWRIGTVLFLKIIEYICTEAKAENYDFGFGDAEYKEIYGDKHWQEVSVYIFAARLYPIFVNLLRTVLRAVELILEYILKKTGLRKKLKRYWRNRLIAKASESVA